MKTAQNTEHCCSASCSLCVLPNVYNSQVDDAGHFLNGYLDNPLLARLQEWKKSFTSKARVRLMKKPSADKIRIKSFCILNMMSSSL